MDTKDLETYLFCLLRKGMDKINENGDMMNEIRYTVSSKQKINKAFSIAWLDLYYKYLEK